ncbi:MAG: cysteine dioxygenase family protein [Chloroflexota bacterium]|nr:cysteine dioxygenase family protein [Chloroflexota bacterium]
MCVGLDQQPTGADEWILDHPPFRRFIDEVNTIRTSNAGAAATIGAIRPRFAELLAADDWLPAIYQQPAAKSGMGSGIGTWLLYRAGDGGLALTALVVPPGAATPVHDHLAWGLVGLYRGDQDEEVFTRLDDGSAPDHADLALAERRPLKPGDFYELLPETDIHRVTTTSDVTSVSLHLLGNDNGCIWRHQFTPETHRVEPFKSGYVNVDCESNEVVAEQTGREALE